MRELIEKEKGGPYIIISFIEKSATKKEKGLWLVVKRQTDCDWSNMDEF